jgi:hypothetical protein
MCLGAGELPHGVGWGRGGVMCPRVTQFQAKTNKSGILAPKSESPSTNGYPSGLGGGWIVYFG